VSDHFAPTFEIMAWYVVRTRSGDEYKAKQALEKQVEVFKKEAFFEKVIIPEEKITELVKGEKIIKKHVFLPGHLFIKMILDEKMWHLVKNTPKILGFIGNQLKPSPISEQEVEEVMLRIAERESKPRFVIGEKARVKEGPFYGFVGPVSTIDPAKGVIGISVNVFERPLVLTIEWNNVEKIEEEKSWQKKKSKENLSSKL